MPIIALGCTSSHCGAPLFIGAPGRDPSVRSFAAVEPGAVEAEQNGLQITVLLSDMITTLIGCRERLRDDHLWAALLKRTDHDGVDLTARNDCVNIGDGADTAELFISELRVIR